ncbi:GmrSD restriction endonuclease domain-containing protein [Tistrella mobilis]|uniref:GmrSD restriction endonucleases N-terminal domain-containing protein n=1 Tax=Tistrella mobilis (strain KA081020-065) TaxID=1110502 RepID=I3TU02_TISMK|nr:DUF262 domain-containing protein [Tistrella mobilis]AFK56240.1 hypothetical protein TMO_b0232 [Tistrella mobilis KA081020-065]
MHTANFTISDILRRAREKALTIPQFQRPFVWKNAQIKLLIDSISRSYPVGSILLLPKTADITLNSRSIQAEIFEDRNDDAGESAGEAPPEEMPSEQYYILDGQQRVTSIVRVFMDADPTHSYYFNVRKMLSHYLRGEDGTDWITRKRKDKNGHSRKEDQDLIRADVVMSQIDCEIYLSQFSDNNLYTIEEFNGDRRKAAAEMAKVRGVFERFRSYLLPVVTIERDAKIESVCRIFETINSTGTRLTTFDLSVAKYYPDPDLQSMWKSAKEIHPILNDFAVDGERALQVIALVSAFRSGKSPEVSRGTLLTMGRDVILSEWNAAITGLAKAYRWAERNGARAPNPPSHNILTAIAALFVISNDSASIYDNEDDTLRKWYFCKILQQGARQAGNYKMGLYFSELSLYSSGKINPTFDKVYMNVDSIMHLYQAADVRYKGLQSLIFATIKNDLFTNQLISEDMVEEHHIFPRALLKKSKVRQRDIDSITNKIPVIRDTNRKIGDDSPYDYFRTRLLSAKEAGTVGALRERMQACLIPGNPGDPDWLEQFKVENYEVFMRRRAQIMADRIRTIIGDAYVDGATEDDDDDSD